MSITQNIKDVFALQKESKRQYALSSAAKRVEKLSALRESVLSHSDEIARALYEDLGKPITDEPPMEVGKVVHDIDNAIANIEEWMAPQIVTTQDQTGNAQAYIQSEPLGQVLILAAWNFPFSLALCPLIPAIAAGNVASVKTNEMAPATALVIEKVVKSVFSIEEVAVFTGGLDEAISLQDYPFDHVFFTGSPAVGKSVMRSAAQNLASVTLELGGKCPAVVGRDANFEAACANIAIGRTFNLGQTCLCVDYALVAEEQLEDFIGGVKSVLQATYYEAGEYQKDKNSRMIDARNFDRVKGYIDDAVARGASIAFGGSVDRESLIIEPTILVNVDPESKILSEEIFGPVLPIITYQTDEDIIFTISNKPKPLGLYVFSENEDFVNYILNNTSSGGVSVNGWANHYFEPALPFGGVNNSVVGCYHGEFGFKEFSHQKSVYKA